MQLVSQSIQKLKDFHHDTVETYKEALNAQYTTFESKYLEFYKTFSELLETSEALGVQLAAVTKQAEDLKQEKRVLLREKQELVIRSNDLEHAIEKLEKQLDIFRSSLSSEHSQNEKLQNELNVMESTNKQCDTKLQQNDRIIDELQCKLKESEIELELMTNKYNTLNKEYISKQKINEAQTSLLVNKLNEVDGAKYEHLHKDIKQLQKQTNEENLKNIDLQQRVQLYESKLQQMTKERDLANSQVSSLLIRIEDLETTTSVQQTQKVVMETVNMGNRQIPPKQASILKRKVHFNQ